MGLRLRENLYAAASAAEMLNGLLHALDLAEKALKEVPVWNHEPECRCHCRSVKQALALLDPTEDDDSG
jgi:hypothetical protein